MLWEILPNIILIALSILYYTDLEQVSFNLSSSSFIPLILIIIVCLLNVLEIYKKVIGNKKRMTFVRNIFTINELFIIIMIVFVSIFILIIPQIGFLFSSFIFIFILSAIWRFRRRNFDIRYFIISFLLSLTFPLIIIYIFENIFKFNLP